MVPGPGQFIQLLWNVAQVMWRRTQCMQSIDLSSKLPSSQYSQASTDPLINNPWRPHLQPTKLKWSNAKSLVPDPTGWPQRSGVHALMCQSKVWSRLYGWDLETCSTVRGVLIRLGSRSSEGRLTPWAFCNTPWASNVAGSCPAAIRKHWCH